MSSTAAGAPKTDGATFPTGDDVGALVVDLGSLYVQAGNAGKPCGASYSTHTPASGEEWPKHFSESFVGVQLENMGASSRGFAFITKLLNVSFIQIREYKHPRHKYPLYFSSLINDTEVRMMMMMMMLGRIGGLFIDVGSATTTVTPVIDGYTMLKHVKEIPVGGDLLDYQLQYLLKVTKM
ncbi:uncharacterized protein LOC129617863 [Condylostylus longicornis]|uniref:uncharacterized protein LOC129617863 n=1 Tax=Condylostylus longicornis TaxID=2530218 RepID=UPI00244E1E51|nr:uncharacterized protein LOC129617863 [Condylostylus longicornis]